MSSWINFSVFPLCSLCGWPRHFQLTKRATCISREMLQVPLAARCKHPWRWSGEASGKRWVGIGGLWFALYAKEAGKNGKKSRQKLDQIAKIKLVNFVTNLLCMARGIGVLSWCCWPAGGALGLGQWGCLAVLLLPLRLAMLLLLLHSVSFMRFIYHAAVKFSPDQEP